MSGHHGARAHGPDGTLLRRSNPTPDLMGMHHMKRLWAVLTAGAAIAVLAACSPTASIDVPPDAVILDVRTPEEYASGHLDGAINLDVNDPRFWIELEELDSEADYIVYCQSGNRSEAAVERMESVGFDSIQDAGGIADAASATGIEIVP